MSGSRRGGRGLLIGCVVMLGMLAIGGVVFTVGTQAILEFVFSEENVCEWQEQILSEFEDFQMPEYDASTYGYSGYGQDGYDQNVVYTRSSP